MKRTTLTLFLCLLFAGILPAQNLAGSLNDDGFIVLSGEGLTLVGFELKSAAGLLVPVPEDNADPFQLLLANNTSQIAYAAPGAPVTLEGELILAAGYNGTVESFFSDVSGNWGGPVVDVGGAISISIPQEPLAEILPEPSGLQMLCVGAFVLAMLRRRKR